MRGWHSRNWMWAVRPIQLSIFLLNRERARRKEERWVVLVKMIRARAGCDLLVFDVEVDVKTVK